MNNSVIFDVYNDLEPCQFTTYDVKPVKYDKYSQMGHNLMESWFTSYNITPRITEGSSTLYINYQTLHTKVSQKTKILNASSFVSSVGGNLGLFIGFSFLDALFHLCQWICKRIHSTK